MQIILYIFFFLLGLVLASFLNALMYRLDKEYKYPEIFTKPSHCEKCGKELKWYELIPIFSYIIYKGKCTKCKKKINIYYPISELFLALSILLLYYNNLPWYTYAILLILFCLNYFDIQYKAIPQTPTLIFLAFSFLYLIVTSLLNQTVILNALISGLVVVGGILLLLVLMYGFEKFKEGFGFGDFLILLSLSAFLNIKQFWLMFWISIFTAVIISVIGFITKKYTSKTALPLLPFFTLGYIVVVTLGDVILKYLGLTITVV
jgi:leader peptidase (prepilin peptidase)/N-methyltransferase